MHKQIKHYLQILLIVLDFLLLNISFFVTLFLFEKSPSLTLVSPYLKYCFFLNFFLAVAVVCPGCVWREDHI